MFCLFSLNDLSFPLYDLFVSHTFEWNFSNWGQEIRGIMTITCLFIKPSWKSINIIIIHLIKFMWPHNELISYQNRITNQVLEIYGILFFDYRFCIKSGAIATSILIVYFTAVWSVRVRKLNNEGSRDFSIFWSDKW